jgi:putative transcriptional regulator
MSVVRYLAALVALASAAPAQTRVSPGQLLVATTQLKDPEFAQSVVLILTSDSRGVQGVWINRPTTFAVSELFSGLKSGVNLYQGGPLRIGINALVRSATQPERSARILPGVWLVAEESAVRDAIAAQAANVRVFLGLCGWSVPQLDDEIHRRGAWTIREGTAGLVFDDDVKTLWNRLGGGGKFAQLPPAPVTSLVKLRRDLPFDPRRVIVLDP